MAVSAPFSPPDVVPQRHGRAALDDVLRRVMAGLVGIEPVVTPGSAPVHDELRRTLALVEGGADAQVRRAIAAARTACAHLAAGCAEDAFFALDTSRACLRQDRATR